MSTVIRAGDVPRIASQLGAVDLNDHLAEARAVVRDAQVRAQTMLDDAQAEADRIGPQARKEAFNKGFAEGFEKGYRSGKQRGETRGYDDAHAAATEKFDEQQGTIITTVNRIIQEMEDTREAIHLAAKRDVLDLAIALATKLTFAIGGLDRNAVQANLDRALRVTQSKTDLTIRAHPDDLTAVEAFAGSVLDRTKQAGGFQVVADESIDLGGCIVRSETCEVDATLAVQLDEIVSLLIGKRDGRSAAESGDSTHG